MWDFADRNVIVTGAASGIGAATTRHFIEAGARVVALDRDADRLESEVASVSNAKVVALVADLGDIAATVREIDRVSAELGEIHHLVNCAASFIAAGAEASEHDWDQALGVNIKGSAMLTSAVAAHMRSSATVVNVSSISAHAAQPNRWTYNATKAAILALTRGQAMDYARRGIRVNAVSPGWIWTAEVARAASGDRARWEPVWGRYHLLERLGEASEVADAIAFLSSSRSSFITGTELMVDGGYSAMGPEGLGDTAQFAGSE